MATIVGAWGGGGTGMGMGSWGFFFLPAIFYDYTILE